MSVRAKFKCVSKQTVDSGFAIALEPVISGSDENAEFFKYTPGGRIQLSTINTAAAEQFQVGSEYYVDFTKATN